MVRHPSTLALLGLLALLAATPTMALQVTTTVDETDGSCLDGDCSLRDAVAAAAAGDTVSVPAGTYNFALGQIEIVRDLAITGAGADVTALSGQDTSRLFRVAAGTTLRLSGTTLREGRANFAGAIYSHGNLELRSVALTNNRADFAGALYCEGSLLLESSLVAANQANSVGAIYLESAPGIVRSSTISGNQANLLTGGIATFGELTLSGSTLIGNRVMSSPWTGGALFLGAPATLEGTLIELNLPQNCDPLLDPNATFSLDGDGSCALGAGNLIGVASGAQPLAANGGPTATHALPAGSPALDAAGACSLLADQRGTTRPQGPACDIGAFERVAGAMATTFCESESFTTDLGALNFSLVGDADQGGAEVVDGRVRVNSDGSSLYRGSDNGGFLHRQVTGDFRAEVKLEGFPVDAGGGYRRAGLTVRTGTGPNDPRVYVEFLPQHPVYLQSALMFDYRGENGVARELASTRLGLPMPIRLAIERRGNLFSAWFSTDGINWTRPAGGAGGTVSINMPATVEVGIMQASYNTSVTLTSEFDDFGVCQPNPEPLPSLPPAAACDPAQPVDVLFLLDASGNQAATFPGAASKFDAALQAIAQIGNVVETSLPGSRAALISFKGGPAPFYNTGAGATVLSDFTAFIKVEAAASAPGVPASNPSTSSPLSHALNLGRQLLEVSARPESRQAVVVLSDFFVNVDLAGNGPGAYRTSELQALSLLNGSGYRSVGQVGWLGNWNGAIRTWDGEALANAMAQGLFLKQQVPGVAMYTLGLSGDGPYRADLPAFLADYGGGLYRQAGDMSALLTAASEVAARLACQ